MGWRGSLWLDYRRRDDRTIIHDRHEGPLRVLRPLYPEGGVCHSVLVHPPGGIVGGDELRVELTLGEGAHALVTTPGATRFYRSAGVTAMQSLRVAAAAASRLEWLPLETIAYRGCEATNALRFELAPGAEMIGWDVTALGLPESDRPFDAGRFTQSIELPGRWLERGAIAAADAGLLDSPLGWAGRRVLATMWFAAGSALVAARGDALLEA
ncbi:MAG: urease accessory protein UreD, partial [Pseudomonadota bacterium]|nr:urease accessory protein UreD [Pseudomonadota bacterium]